jgi:3-phosphoshikimate 1-carboxyvinyltransferase
MKNSVSVSRATKPLIGEMRIVGDKSVSFRSLFFSVMTSANVGIIGLNDGDDIKKTINAFEKLGVEFEFNEGDIIIQGRAASLKQSDIALNLGGSATSARFMLGLLSGQHFSSSIYGNESLNKRPMSRLTDLLNDIGADINLSGNSLPATINSGRLRPSKIDIKYPSAQIQTSLILALLNAEGESELSYSSSIRDHTEKMMQNFGFKFDLIHGSNKIIRFSGQQKIVGDLDYNICGDPSMAAYFIVAAILVPGSDLLLKDIYIQPNRIGYIEVLKNMCADIEIQNIRNIHNEEVADIRVRHSLLSAVEISAEMAPRMIDEYPIIAVAASFANGKTIMHGLAELKIKESDRINSILISLSKLGIACHHDGDSMMIIGSRDIPEGGVSIDSFGDHRIVMSFAIFGLMTKKDVIISDISPINATFPSFFESLWKI